MEAGYDALRQPAAELHFDQVPDLQLRLQVAGDMVVEGVFQVGFDVNHQFGVHGAIIPASKRRRERRK
jgi:hypothetical protein